MDHTRPPLSLLRLLEQTRLGPVESYQKNVRTCLRERFLEETPTWNISKTASPFKRRVTCLEWHPTYHNVVAVASHAGDILLWNYEEPSRNIFNEGVGYGHGSITEMKFHPENPTLIYAAAVDGRFWLQDLQGKFSEVYLDTMDIQFWWCSFDFSREHNVIFVGDNVGNAVLLDSSGRKICKYSRFHKGKIKHVEFCPARSWTLATSSVDHTVVLWDIRMLRLQNCTVPRGSKYNRNAVAIMDHGSPVNSAYFDPIYGSRILTTSQNSELRVYDPHDWSEPTNVMEHPHRHFQHITDIQATWHPLYDDLCVVGRYPASGDPDQTRTVDLIDLGSGKQVGSFYSSSAAGIIGRNKFNKRADALASGMGYHALIWQPSCEIKSKMRMDEREKAKSKQRLLPGDPLSGRGTKKTKKRKKDSDDGQCSAKKMKRQHGSINVSCNKRKYM